MNKDEQGNDAVWHLITIHRPTMKSSGVAKG